jgi:hypothetical protein
LVPGPHPQRVSCYEDRILASIQNDEDEISEQTSAHHFAMFAIPCHQRLRLDSDIYDRHVKSPIQYGQNVAIVVGINPWRRFCPRHRQIMVPNDFRDPAGDLGLGEIVNTLDGLFTDRD